MVPDDTENPEAKEGADEDDDALAAQWAAALDDDEEGADGGGGDDDDTDMAAAMAAMESDGDSDDSDDDGELDMAAAMGMEESGESAKILNQDEIDSLLGFDSDDDDDKNVGIKALVDNGLVNYERLPMLDRIFDQLGRYLSTSLRNLTSDNVEASIDDITAVRFGEYLNSVPLPAMLAIFKAEEWDNQGLLVADSNLIYSIVDVLLGGRKGAAALRIEGRPYTTIECNLVERMLHVVLNDLSAAFDPLSPVTFRFARLETNPRFAVITQDSNAAVLVKMRIDMEDRGGMLEMIIPYATLEPVRELLMQMFMGEKFGRDSIWENHLSGMLVKTDIEVEALLGEMTVSLKDAMQWQIGTTVQLEKKVGTPVTLRCGEEELFEAHLGQHDGYMAVKLEREIEREIKEEV